MRKRFCLLPALALALLCACSKGAAKTPPTRPADFTSTERQFNTPADGDTIAIFDTSLGAVSYTHLDVYKRQVLHLAAKPVQPCRDPPRVLLVGKNLPRAEEIQLSLLGRADLGGDLFPGVALEHAAQKARKAAVIAVGCVGHMRFVRPVSYTHLWTASRWWQI